MLDTTTADTPLPTSAFAPLPHLVVVRVSGPGTDQFLHGQFSQKLEDITSTYSPRAAASTPKGRAYCLTRMVRQDSDILLAIPAVLADDTLDRLRKYLMLFRGTSMAIAPQARVLGLFGDEAANRLHPDASVTLRQPCDTCAVGEHRLIRTEPTAEGLARYEFWQLGPLSEALQEQLEQCQETSELNWQASQIAAGIAELSPASVEEYVPQMLNWQHLNGLHFKKGCYTGQEVIARMHFLGQLKKSLFRLRYTGNGAPTETGVTIHSGDRTVGEIVSSIEFSDGHGELLAVVRHDADFSTLTIAGTDQKLTPLPLPYSVPEQTPDT
ncbi:CAF17-like 4Fe-4S cluster assembly/insertion protein YgfZ [Marinobacter zhejiangensis]|uniref:Aminomethyltransferase folate-binding domain-containing protein n=1 Tax=Marinobacter zhejiangensis TaxID=488535 RepID=A0A1I4N8Y9_9GAMM|nr:folate-binding protein YgfZ [Marinobacter zhejiangensis]SFM11959.1 hypothetical protein SAMN04487963_1213 [Marinobacter zhejiangensis]